jgi:hypothetical protein
MSHSKMLTTRRRNKKHLKQLAVTAKRAKKAWRQKGKIGAAGKGASTA